MDDSVGGKTHDAALRRIAALEQERDDYILKQKVWEEANDELRSDNIRLKRDRCTCGMNRAASPASGEADGR